MSCSSPKVPHGGFEKSSYGKDLSVYGSEAKRYGGPTAARSGIPSDHERDVE
jgi:hypothetical protein